MTSSIINFIVEKYLSNIVEINPEKTKSSLWSGTFEMNNLKIKKPSFSGRFFVLSEYKKQTKKPSKEGF